MMTACRKRTTRYLANRSEEHTSELQSQSNLVCRLLLEKKKKKTDFDGCVGQRELPILLAGTRIVARCDLLCPYCADDSPASDHTLATAGYHTITLARAV